MIWVLLAYAATVVACFVQLMKFILAYGDPDFFMDDLKDAIITSFYPIDNLITYALLNDRNFVIQYYGGYEVEAEKPNSRDDSGSRSPDRDSR